METLKHENILSLTLIRGLPGSGKSTLAKALWQTNVDMRHFEADMYHMKNGVYVFDTRKIKEAHKWCQESTAEALMEGASVVVSNTFTQMWEMKPYIEMAEKLDASLQVVECIGNFGNIHDVPSDVITKMRERWEPYEPLQTTARKP
jgi:predicted kinase